MHDEQMLVLQLKTLVDHYMLIQMVAHQQCVAPHDGSLQEQNLALLSRPLLVEHSINLTRFMNFQIHKTRQIHGTYSPRGYPSASASPLSCLSLNLSFLFLKIDKDIRLAWKKVDPHIS